MSPDAAYEEGVGWIPPQGGPQADRVATAESLGWRLVLTTSGGCDDGSGVAGDEDLRLRPPEYISAIYCD